MNDRGRIKTLAFPWGKAKVKTKQEDFFYSLLLLAHDKILQLELAHSCGMPTQPDYLSYSMVQIIAKGSHPRIKISLYLDIVKMALTPLPLVFMKPPSHPLPQPTRNPSHNCILYSSGPILAFLVINGYNCLNQKNKV